MIDSVEAWYFSEDSRKLRYGDDREIAVGVVHEVVPPVRCCKHGLHGSVRAIDALGYAPGPVVWRVRLSGEMDSDNDKIAAQRREYTGGGIDVSETLFAFARACAFGVVHLWDAPNVVKEFLRTGDASLQDAACDAAWAAARAAACDAAWAAARAAARAAACDAARAAACDAAWDAAWAAACAAACDAACDAARDAARAAAWDRQNAQLESILWNAIGGQS